MGRLFRFSYYRKIQLSFILLVLLPMITVSIFSYSITKAKVLEKIQLTNQSFLDVMAKDITKTIDDLTFASHFFVQDEFAREYLRKYAQMDGIQTFEDYQNYEQLQELFNLAAAKTLNSHIHMFLVNDDEFIISSAGKVAEGSDVLTELKRRWGLIQSNVEPNLFSQMQWMGIIVGMEKGDHSYLGKYPRGNLNYWTQAETRLLVILMHRIQKIT
jgi:two-component system sensor histidine kinase YesM